MLRLVDILTEARVRVHAGGGSTSKAEVLRAVAELLGPGSGSAEPDVERLLCEREELRSTGIGDGVAIPHCFVDTAHTQSAALLLYPHGVEFDAIDGRPAQIVIGVVGPKRPTEHLRVLARVSRVLHDRPTRERLIACADPASAFACLRERDESIP